jgi:hypothetical protein
VLGWKYVTEEWDNRVNRFAPRGSLTASEMGVHPTHSVREGAQFAQEVPGEMEQYGLLKD